MKKVETIGNRISVLRDDEVSSFVIMPTDVKWKIYLLLGWLLLWTASGVAVAVNYFSLTNANYKIVVIVWMSFWAYFEFKIGKAFLFRKFGKEKIWVKGDRMYYWRDIAKTGKTLAFEKELIKDIALIEKKNDFFTFMNESFWIIGGESISFNYGAKSYNIGIQLSEEDARELVRQLKFTLKG